MENLEIKRKIIIEQKGLKEKKDKQKRIVTNEMKRKYSETQEERFSRMARERASGVPVRKRLGNYSRGGGDGE